MMLDVVTWTITAPGAAGVAAAPIAGDSAIVRAGPSEIAGVLIGYWTKSQAVGFSRLTFPYGHDNVRNLDNRNLANLPVNSMIRGVKQLMKTNDLMSVVQAGSAVAGDVELICAQIAYPDIGGGSDMFVDAQTVWDNIEECVTIEDTVTPTVASTYSGARAMNAVVASLKANRKYAVLGAFIGQACGALTIRGQDTANQRCAIPGNANLLSDTRDHFINLADYYGMPLVPVINATNAGGTFIEVVQDENLTAVPFSLNLALLKQ
jgi:hypothetical protein